MRLNRESWNILMVLPSTTNGDSKKRHPFEVAKEIAWDENEAEQRELEHIE